MLIQNVIGRSQIKALVAALVESVLIIFPRLFLLGAFWPYDLCVLQIVLLSALLSLYLPLLDIFTHSSSHFRDYCNSICSLYSCILKEQQEEFRGQWIAKVADLKLQHNKNIPNTVMSHEGSLCRPPSAQTVHVPVNSHNLVFTIPGYIYDNTVLFRL